MLVSDHILKFLEKNKVKKVFLITGGAITFIVDALKQKNSIHRLRSRTSISDDG